MKIRLARKIMKHQPENDPVGYKFNNRWVERWEEHESYPPQKQDHRINKAIKLAIKYLVKKQ